MECHLSSWLECHLSSWHVFMNGDNFTHINVSSEHKTAGHLSCYTSTELSSSSYLLYRWKCSGLNNLIHLFLLVLYGGQETLNIHLPVIVVFLPPLVHLCNLHQNWLTHYQTIIKSSSSIITHKELNMNHSPFQKWIILSYIFYNKS